MGLPAASEGLTEWTLPAPSLLSALVLGSRASCGFRVFVPPLVLAIAQRLDVPVTDSAPEWLGSWPALIVLGTAATVELFAYYIPWLDNALDSVASPAAVLAGILVTAGVVGEMHPAARWGLAIVGGGGAAGVAQAATVFTRALSSATTGGLANFLVSTLELISAVVMSIMTLLLAPLALLFLVVLIVWLVRVLARWRARRRAPST